MTRLRERMVNLFAHQYAWYLHRRKGDEYLAENDMQHMTYRYLAIIPGFVLVFLILAPYAAFVGQYPAPTILYVLVVIALLVPTIITLRIYRNESAAIKRAGRNILNASEGAPYHSLVVAFSPLGILSLALFVFWIAASSSN